MTLTFCRPLSGATSFADKPERPIEHIGTSDPETTVSLNHFVHTFRADRIVTILSVESHRPR
jgi:hypothetical protein